MQSVLPTSKASKMEEDWDQHRKNEQYPSLNEQEQILYELLMNSEELFLMKEFQATLETLQRALSLLATNKKPESDFYNQKILEFRPLN